jgi:hypothetical protein
MDFFIEYLDASNGFRQARKEFETEERAWEWALENLGNPSKDQIRRYRPDDLVDSQGITARRK